MRPTTLALIGCLLAACQSASADVAAEFLQRQAAVDGNSVDALMKLGRWAEDRALNWQAADQYYRVLALDPDHNEAYERLSRIGDNERLPDDPQREQQILADVKPWMPNAQLFTNPHWIIVFDTSEQFARGRGTLLERTHKTFFDAFRRAEQRPLPLRERLVCILFASHDAYIAYAKGVDNNNMGWSSGYYSSRTNRIAYFDDDAHPMFAEAKAHIEKLTREIDERSAQMDRPEVRRNGALMQQLRRERGALIEERRKVENRIRAIANETNASKTTHEAVHQLSFNTGMQDRRTHYPFWLAEGLATNFEAENPAAPFGPFIDNAARRVPLRNANDARLLMPLRDFVVLTQLPGNEDQVRALYAQAWGLFNFLFKMRHAQMRAYLAALRDAPPGRRTPEEMLKSFDDAFGPMHVLDNEWHAWLDRQ